MRSLQLLIFIFLFGCLAEPVQKKNALNNSNDNVSGNGNLQEIEPPPIDSQADILWLNSNVSQNSVTLNIDNQKTIYLIGKKVSNFLKEDDNFLKTYCIEIQFPESGNARPNRLRFRMNPQFSNSFGLASNNRFFVVNTSSAFGNDVCQRDSLQKISGEEKLISLTSVIETINGVKTVVEKGSSPVTQVSEVCSTCTNIISSSKILLFSVESNSLLKSVDTNKLSAESLIFRVDLNSNSDSGRNACTDSECKALGFNCCVNGQCVNEKQLKTSGINLDPSGFALAETEKNTDANWYKKYPQFYFSCLETPPITESPAPDPPESDDPIGDAEDRLITQVKDLECLQELEKNSDAQPFHISPFDSSKTYIKCNVSDSSDDLFYENVLKRLYTQCGCSEKNDLSVMVSQCPAYTYKPIFKSGSDTSDNSNITEILCITPSPAETPLPFQDLEVIVNSKSAPHRFFNVDNQEIDPLKNISANVNTTQEGEEFSYLDDLFIFPRNTSFNMNSILGQMTINLTKALPAKMIKVEFDKQYIISTLDGSYFPCPTCGKDSWFNNFTAFPSATLGKGAQNIGFTTKRDTFSSNTTLGNYEDTIFNRACFLPPTMIPYSHAPESDVQEQRLNRLKSQAAMFANGYQRDWFGFNQGALIGSFDGVTWFAVGTGRIVRSTSDTLYLAINAPFADLASPSSHRVAVQEFDFQSVGALFDYDPTKQINDSTQNSAGSCQENHKCEVDSDCISTLGWEYMCADVGFQRSKWPNFEATGASEVAGDSRSGSIIDFLQQQTLPPGSGSKRCVYRGAGAPCRADYENINDSGLRKALSCAPNFYCAKLSDGAGFNDKVARFGAPLADIPVSFNHLFGQDANVLGRPLDYVNKGNLGGLPLKVQNAIESNLLEMDPSGAGQFGLCRPGKKLPSYETPFTARDTNPAAQHKDSDFNGRTDYISQIGSCNSTLYLPTRYSSCPIIDTDGDYAHLKDDFLNDDFIIDGFVNPQPKEAVTEILSFAQNSCGLESLSSEAAITTLTTGDELKNFSAFKSIEGSTLTSGVTIFTPTLARDACLRKAGSVCHTDLDCSPNQLHADSIDLVANSFFGNLAEKAYYSEPLICGQPQNEPSKNDPEFFSYNPANNRCCRPIGEDITMFTENSPRAPESEGINSSVFGGLNPRSPERYSRYSVVEAGINSLTLRSNLIRPSANTLDSDGNKSIDNSVNITNPNQWKTIHETGAKTCCGGGWIRKFEDDSNNWAQNRFNFDVTNFRCLNSKSALLTTDNAQADYQLNQFILESERRNFCIDPRTASAANGSKVGSCAIYEFNQISGAFSNGVTLKPSFRNNPDDARLSSSFSVMRNNDWDAEGGSNNDYSFHIFLPLFSSFNNFQNNGTEGTSRSELLNSGSKGYVLEWSQAPDNASGDELRQILFHDKFIATKIPSFVTFSQIDDLNIELTSPQATDFGTKLSCVKVDPNTGSGYSTKSGLPLVTPGANIANNFEFTCGNPSIPYGNAGLCNLTSSLWFEEDGYPAMPVNPGDEAFQLEPGLSLATSRPLGVDSGVLDNPTLSKTLSGTPNLGDQDGNGSSDEVFCPDTPGNNCCYLYDPATRDLRVALSNVDILNKNNYGVGDIALEIEFKAVGTLPHELEKVSELGNIAVDDPLGLPHRRSTEPGHPFYYLDKLARLEYAGIPQMTYEPIYCNDVYQKLVPGIFDSNIETVMDFRDSPLSFIDPLAETPWQNDTAPSSINANPLNLSLATSQEMLAIQPIFSDNKFKCCLELGARLNLGDDSSRCCSGFAVEDEDDPNAKICKLPVGTDLFVYFNKFVSSEGLKETENTSNLTSEDFDVRTGEPLKNSDVIAKITDLGQKHCQFSKVRVGGAFGDFENSISQVGSQDERVFGIVDETNDDNPDELPSPSGFIDFSNGFRWNHHIYCDFD